MVSHLYEAFYVISKYLYIKKSFDTDHKWIVSVSNVCDYDYLSDFGLEIFFYTLYICVLEKKSLLWIYSILV